MDHSERLRRLIVACRDDGRALDFESGLVEGESRLLLSRLARERDGFADGLRRFGEPGQRASVSTGSRMRQLARSIRVLAGGRHHGDSIAACRRSCDRIEASYTDAIEQEWSTVLLPTLIEHRRQIQQARGELLALQY